MIVASVAFLSLGSSIFQSPNNALYMSSAPREALGFAGSLGSLARYAGMAIGIEIASRVLYAQMAAAAGGVAQSTATAAPAVFLFGFRSVFYLLMISTAFGFALTCARFAIKRRSRRAC